MMVLLLILIVPYFIIYILFFAVLMARPMAGNNPNITDAAGRERTVLNLPLLSVIIPFRNEAASLPAIIEDLALQEWPRSLTEIILIDDGSTDNSFAEAAMLAARIDNCRVIRNEGSGKKQAIAFAIGITSGDIIVTTDADCRLNHGWLTGIARVYNETGAEVITGAVYPLPNPGILNQLLHLEMMAIHSVSWATSVINHPVMASGANLAFTREVSAGYIDFIRPSISSGDDMFLLHHAKRDRRKIVFNYSEGAEVLTLPPTGLLRLIKQRIRWSSKGFKYRDSDTILLGAVTSLTNIFLISFLVLSAFIPGFFRIAAAAWFLKSVPDFLILLRAASVLNRRRLLLWFLPLHLIYPVYVLLVSFAGIIYRPPWK
ncbi:MAG: glycosyltransferase [Bacteroidia bacterium]|nr:MAG: glycosyltransferase [Bacteroidia bacterium]